MENTQTQITPESLQSMVDSFAKSTKVSKSKAMEFANQIVAMRFPKRNAVTGRQLGEESTRIRQEIRKLASEQPGLTTTGADLAAKFATTNTVINNNMRALISEGVVKMAGYVEQTGKRGRKPVVWELI